MREILFRGKRIDNGEWVEGFYCQRKEKILGGIKTRHMILVPDADSYSGARWIDVNPTTVGQCVSGLTDKNGKKIFEGNIISVPGSKKPGLPGIVLFHQLDAKYILFRQRYSYLNLINVNNWGYVIGNVHDNPELLDNSELLEDKL